MRKDKDIPSLIIQVAGGVADYQLVPCSAEIQVVHIDWDNVTSGDDPIGQLVEINGWIKEVKKIERRVPKSPVGYLQRLLEQLEDAKRNCQEMILEMEGKRV